MFAESGNGLEFTFKAMLLWAAEAGVKLHFIQPGKPTQSGPAPASDEIALLFSNSL